MNVHIVSRDSEQENVLGRLVRALICGTGWTCGSQPDSRSDVNYFFPYLEWGKKLAEPGKSAAWFTHYDKGRKSKEDAWQRCAASVALRTTCAPVYFDGLSQNGQTEIVTPCVDLAKFTMRERDPYAQKHRIGVSGYVYPGGRKGEELVKRLVDNRALLGQEISVVASGKGWPCPTTHYEWAGLQSYYHSLDVFLCTATIEGLPMPPLEAMACGVPIVIPRGVGLLDDLPTLQNIHRYKAGDYDDMHAAVMAAISEPVNAMSLRSAVAVYNSQAWVSAHMEAFDKAFGAPIFTPGPLPKWEGRAGVYVVAYGDPARECAKRNIKSVHKHMPGLPVALVSDANIKGADIFIQHADEDIGGRSVKTQIYELAPGDWEYVVYLDADTELIGDISFLFDILRDGWDVFFCTNPAQYHLASAMRRPDNQEECDITFEEIGTDNLLQLNGGVFGFRRNERTQRLFSDWHEEWQRWGARDQAALDRALYRDPLRVYTLCRDWNCVTRYHEVTKETAIAHYPMQARRWKGRINGRLDSSEAWGAVHPAYKPKP